MSASRARRALVFAFLVLAVAAGPAVAAPGDLDTTFATDGRALDPAGLGAWDAVAQADNRAVLQRAAAASDGRQLQRFTATGSPDGTFGIDGLSEASGFTSPLAQVERDAEGRLVTAAGIFGNPAGIGLARYTADGLLDDTFSEDGQALFQGSTAVKAMALAPDGKIVTAGFVGNASGGRDLRIDRFLADGSARDETFGGGIVTLHPTDLPGRHCHSSAVHVQSDGRVVVAGSCDTMAAPEVFVVRLNENGTTDNDFASGKADLAPFFVVTKLAAGPGGTLYAAGRIDDPALESNAADFGLVRLTAGGARDSAFGSGQILRTPVTANCDEPRDLLVQPDGKVLTIGHAAGCSSTYTGVGVTRHDATGALDVGFHGDGVVAWSQPGEFNDPHAAVLQPNGGLLVAGERSASGSTASFLLRLQTGLAGPSGNVTFAPAALEFPSTAVGATSATQSLTITNDTGGPIDAEQVTFTGPFLSDNGANCLVPLAQGASCTIDVAFKPTINGASSGTLKLRGAGSTVLGEFAGLSGTATGGPAASFNATALDLGMGEIGKETARKTLVLTNSGNTPMQVDKVEFSGPFTGQTADCVGILAAGANCEMEVAFAADAQGPRQGELRVFADVPGQSAAVALSGIGLNAGAGSDGNDPDIAIAGPTAGTVVTLGSPGPVAAFTCSDTRAGDSGIRRCKAFDVGREIVPDEVLDTSVAGKRTFRVEAGDHAGRTRVATVEWEVVAPVAPVAPAGPAPAGSGRYSVLQAGDVVTPRVPYVLADGKVVDHCSADGKLCTVAAVCEQNDNQYDARACAAKAEAIQKASLSSAVDWQAASLAGGLSGFAPASALPKPKWGIRDAGGSVIATGDGSLIGQAGGNVISTGGGNLSVKAGKIWVPKGVTVLVRKAGTVIGAAGNIISTDGASVIATGGGNFVFKEDGWQALRGGTVIATGGGNVIATGGGNVIATGGGNLIGQAGGNLIGQAGGNAIVIHKGSFAALGAEALPQSMTNFIELSFGNAELSTQLYALSSPGAAVARASAKKKPRKVVVGKSVVSVRRPGLYRSTVTLTKQGRALLKKLKKSRKKAKLTLQTTMKRNGGRPLTASRKLTVKVRAR